MFRRGISNRSSAVDLSLEIPLFGMQGREGLPGSLTVVNRRRGRKGLCGLIFFVKFENNACSMG